MRVELEILGFAAAGTCELPLPAARLAVLPAPEFRSRKARLPGLACELARIALAEEELGSDGSVLLGTALGCLTETAAFVENLIAEDGASPKPRAFTASVHNAIASEVARRLGAHGECQTFVQGELSHIAPLFAAARARARGLAGASLVGALDEWTAYVARGRAACGLEGPAAEGGALFHLAGEPGRSEVLARVTDLAWGCPADPRAWVGAREGVDAVLASAAGIELVSGPTVDLSPFGGDFPACGALALSLAVALLSGEAQAEALGLTGAPRSLAVLSATRFGEWGWVRLEVPRP